METDAVGSGAADVVVDEVDREVDELDVEEVADDVDDASMVVVTPGR